MKKFFIILTLIFSINTCFAAGQYNSILDNIENSLYGFTYTTSDDLSRLSRIEQSVYGQAKSGAVQERLNALKNDMSADLIGQEITPKEDTFAEEEDKIVQEKLLIHIHYALK